MAKRSKYDKYFSPGTHRSITAFSKHAAGGSKRRKSYTERRRNKIVGIVLACILGAAVVFTAAFFVTDTLLGISDANVETTQKAEKDNKGNKDKNNKGGKNLAQERGSERRCHRLQRCVRLSQLSLVYSGCKRQSSVIKGSGERRRERQENSAIRHKSCCAHILLQRYTDAAH